MIFKPLVSHWKEIKVSIKIVDSINKITEIIIRTKSKKAVQNSIKQLVKDANSANSIYKKINKLIADKKQSGKWWDYTTT